MIKLNKIKLNIKLKNKRYIQLHNGVGYSKYLDSKPALYSSTRLATNEIELLSPAPTYNEC
ncbi:hypothetical protein BpHYR1_013913 [Brachionus plicatilis]|uniref:Uncharacterized protein n=1 Tax=Brachionus plicatilis TaxID=10195 RepID=A0A3M7Q934_BRAPC|nr:hypothetical protein BpHYR1_013913 [Brachionus plicatilis]